MKKIAIVINENGTISFGQRICTVYKIEKEFTYRTIRLFNLCYIKSRDEFAFNKAIQLPRKLIERYDGATNRINSKIREMEGIGILNIDLIAEKIGSFEECKGSISYSEYRNKLLNRPKENLNSIEVLTQLRQEVIMAAAKNDSISKIESESV